jgi:hypothetical protein
MATLRGGMVATLAVDVVAAAICCCGGWSEGMCSR